MYIRGFHMPGDQGAPWRPELWSCVYLGEKLLERQCAPRRDFVWTRYRITFVVADEYVIELVLGQIIGNDSAVGERENLSELNCLEPQFFAQAARRCRGVVLAGKWMRAGRI